MPSFSLYDVDVFFREEGSGVPIMLGHSSTGSGGQWRDLIAELSERYRVVSPDHLGYGRTGAYPGDLPLMRLEIDILEALLERFEESAHFIGHSYGGSVLTRVAVRNPDKVRSLALVEPTLFYLLEAFGRKDEHAEIRSAADRVIHYVEAGDKVEAARGFIDYWVNPGAYDTMDSRVQTSVTTGMTKLRVEWPAAFEPWGAKPENLSALQMPIQLLVGSKTTAAARAVVHVLREIWPSASYAEIKGVSHMGPVTHPRRVNPIIARFLDSVDSA